MSKHLQRDLESIERELLAVSSVVEEMILHASIALFRRQGDVIPKILASDHAVDQREVKIEEECLKILALHQPVATDLRRTAAVLKINNDLERIGDLAVNLAEIAGRLCAEPSLTIPDKLQQMWSISHKMVGQSLDAFVQLNVVAATEVCRRDDEVDTLRDEVEQELLGLAAQDPSRLRTAFQLCLAAQHLGRIADHATNIAEDAIYLVGGEIARHRHHAAARLRILNPKGEADDEVTDSDRRGRSGIG